MTTLLLDADIIAFQVAAVSQQSYKFPNGIEGVRVDDWEDVVPRIDAEVSKLTEKLKTDKVIVCLSCPTEENWRLKVLPTYKANRDYSKRPVHLKAVKDYLADNWPSYRRPTLEADDIMGILSTMKGLPKSLVEQYPEFANPGKKVIVSEDKDMKTIPGWLFNPAKDLKPRQITEAEADWWHLYQTLVGDTTDGYTGLPGMGPKKATALIKEPGVLTSHDMWELVAFAYFLRKQGETPEAARDAALVQARVARICRASDYDFKRKEVILWTP